ncbi:methyl-accepting chemotaxis protein [Edaphosphingomonas haloaromaticamans]|uniref:Methyl-accepting chemotaxis protein 2 n=1 Tax=Edaphosphingomonas haloaromaticamans TaxID=653954 RepID=A0A1S1HHK4_9SPHN|nr:methyl-accepting chemotaxis protein [Sphingomonas haloaromaticamans]OHT20961.1 Methyl-accepting chemotaxis protein 2 [Sphingomonas haloaromaticamans]
MAIDRSPHCINGCGIRGVGAKLLARLGTDEHLARLGERCGDFALQCSDVAGFVAQVNQRIEDDHGRLESLRASVARLNASQQEADDAAVEIRRVARHATDLIRTSHDDAVAALDEIGGLIDHVVAVGDELEGFTRAIEHVAAISGQLDAIARQTGMLAINATIEAARAGHAASGFAAVAGEVKRLAGSARSATAAVRDGIERLDGSARRVIGGMRSGTERGRVARSRTGDISGALRAIAALVTQFDERSAAIERAGREVTGHVATLDAGLEDFLLRGTENASALARTRQRLDELEAASNRMLDQVAHSGIATPDQPFIAMAREAAAGVETAIAAALAEGALAEADLFDTAYAAIPGSDPPQFLTRFVPFADAAIRPLLDAATARHSAIVGCCLIDRNGHLPTHISTRSQPQRAGDRRWNLENARNRQIFMDHQTRDALDREGDWFLYTYRQDLGEGRYRPLRSVFVPLRFAGRRWGCYELGYLI